MMSVMSVMSVMTMKSVMSRMAVTTVRSAIRVMSVTSVAKNKVKRRNSKHLKIIDFAVVLSTSRNSSFFLNSEFLTAWGREAHFEKSEKK